MIKNQSNGGSSVNEGQPEESGNISIVLYLLSKSQIRK